MWTFLWENVWKSVKNYVEVIENILSHKLHFGDRRHIKEVLHLLPQKAPKLACFEPYLTIINIFLQNNICIL